MKTNDYLCGILICKLIIPGVDEAGMGIAAGDIHADSLAAETEEKEAAGDAVDDDVEGVAGLERD